jgi:glutaconate CoA-transferase subunit B
VSAPPAEPVRLAALAAREIRDRAVCFVGVGVPSLAAMAAKRHHAARAVLIYESGAIDTDPPLPPLSTGSPAVVADTAMIGSCLDVFAMLQQGRFDLGLLSAAQVDRFGNLNSTVLGP